MLADLRLVARSLGVGDPAIRRRRIWRWLPLCAIGIGVVWVVIGIHYWVAEGETVWGSLSAAAGLAWIAVYGIELVRRRTAGPADRSAPSWSDPGLADTRVVDSAGER